MSQEEGASKFLDMRVSLTGLMTVATLVYGIFFWGGQLHQKVDANNEAILEVVRALRQHVELFGHPHQAARTEAIEQRLGRMDVRLQRVEDKLLDALNRRQHQGP